MNFKTFLGALCGLFLFCLAIVSAHAAETSKCSIINNQTCSDCPYPRAIRCGNRHAGFLAGNVRPKAVEVKIRDRNGNLVRTVKLNNPPADKEEAKKWIARRLSREIRRGNTLNLGREPFFYDKSTVLHRTPLEKSGTTLTQMERPARRSRSDIDRTPISSRESRTALEEGPRRSRSDIDRTPIASRESRTALEEGPRRSRSDIDRTPITSRESRLARQRPIASSTPLSLTDATFDIPVVGQRVPPRKGSTALLLEPVVSGDSSLKITLPAALEEGPTAENIAFDTCHYKGERPSPIKYTQKTGTSRQCSELALCFTEVSCNLEGEAGSNTVVNIKVACKARKIEGGGYQCSYSATDCALDPDVTPAIASELAQEQSSAPVQSVSPRPRGVSR